MRVFDAVAAGLASKKIEDLPLQIKNGINAMRRVAQGINPHIVGTAKHKSSYFGDIDLLSQAENPDKVILALQDIVKHLPSDIYFSDMKIGGTKKRGRHWTRAQVIKGKNGTLSIQDAIRQPAITKLDVILPVHTRHGKRYVEMTNFIYIPGISAPFGDFIKEMDKDIAKYTLQNRKLKVIKRKLSKLLWKDLKKDQSEIKRLFSYIKGPAGFLGTLLADCEVARLLVRKKNLRAQQLLYLSKVRNKKITMRNLKKLEQELSDEINQILPKINATQK